MQRTRKAKATGFQIGDHVTLRHANPVFSIGEHLRVIDAHEDRLMLGGGNGDTGWFNACDVDRYQRSLDQVAHEIKRDWKNPYFGAVPYLQAMAQMRFVGQSYGADDEWTIIIYFLSNATGWKGETARRIKKELKAMEGRGRKD